MTNYTATLENGETLTRSSKRDYSLAWAVFIGDECFGAGFARDDAAARSAASSTLSRVSGRAHFNRCTSGRRKTIGEAAYHREEIARMGGVAAWGALVAATERKTRLELVPATAA